MNRVLLTQDDRDGMVTQLRRHVGTAAGRSGRHRTQLTGNVVGGLLHLAATFPPGLRYGRKQLQKTRFRVVGTAVEGPPIRGQEARHRPAALPGEGNGGVHVDRVDIGPFLAIHLDVDEARVHHRRHLVVLERFVGHDVTPVTRGVSDRQQNRHVARGGVSQRLRCPLLPMHGVVGVLAQVRTGGLREGIGSGETGR